MPLLRVTCAFCSWQAEGELEQTLERQITHRRDEHGITQHQRRRIHGGARRINKLGYDLLTDEERSEIEEEIERRKRLHGVGEGA